MPICKCIFFAVLFSFIDSLIFSPLPPPEGAYDKFSLGRVCNTWNLFCIQSEISIQREIPREIPRASEAQPEGFHEGFPEGLIFQIVYKTDSMYCTRGQGRIYHTRTTGREWADKLTVKNMEHGFITSEASGVAVVGGSWPGWLAGGGLGLVWLALGAVPG